MDSFIIFTHNHILMDWDFSIPEGKDTVLMEKSKRKKPHGRLR
jgi:hypothetical protein